MRNALLRRFVIALTSLLVIFAAFAAGIGVYAAVLALWPLGARLVTLGTAHCFSRSSHH